MSRVAFIGLGCSKNTTDLEYLMGYLRDSGLDIVNDITSSDYIVINTCGFIEPAVMEAIENIVQTGEKKPEGAKIIAAGCMVERFKDEFEEEFPEVDFYTGVHTLKEAGDFILKDSGLTIDESRVYGSARLIANHPYYAYIKIADGCNNRCSYCIIPSIRGDLKSRPEESIIREAEELIRSGVKEIILISQDSTKYGIDLYGEGRLVQLVEKINDLAGDFFIRLLYLNPDGINEDDIRRFSEIEKLVKYFEIPVQHISDKILSKMHRKSDSRKIKDVFSNIRKVMPEAFIRTTFIVGFPGEDENDFEELKGFLRDFAPDYAGFFEFQPEEGTKAFDMSDYVDNEKIESRILELESIQEQNTVERLKKMQNKEILAFAEGFSEDIEFIPEGRAIFQTPDIDGKTFFIDGRADRGYGPYKCSIEKIVYPDIYCKIVS
ncbi:Ribosomal protein S12 methylthiotransferase rimO [Flexistipes sinusarabici DSM 4947]|uniref:Ribosomal protein uS12 methylthiotransferase RimO n=1 Tax=Flexistipes sinusarabici (strain ATCC 49648 / DSM 4947 / MAS 10) TaxID=717231 RepID=F8E9P2_FLESM|nr:30S ribosomal protein S12 methylthiotransferase RimO [Flexistipes sinusarabici]AEI14225.1 Ribosomal protein S12 methylthiotransferase rimO [Flexistipes sinusarabici DSM 4947]